MSEIKSGHFIAAEADGFRYIEKSSPGTTHLQWLTYGVYEIDGTVATAAIAHPGEEALLFCWEGQTRVTLAGATYALPAVGLHQVLWADAASGQETGRTDVAGQPVFVTARPDGRELWVNFAPPDNGKVQVIDSMTHEVKQTLEPGNGILHMEFTPRGREVWMSARDDNRVVIYDSRTYEKLGEIEAQAPSGIFFTARAHRTGL